jgi:DeoR family transcriptional regulator, fructose operon transcriptional repressor
MKDNENIYAEERQKKIFELIKEKGRITVKELSGFFNISDVTIRNDLKILSDSGSILRTHGGAIYSEQNGTELPVNIRKNKQKDIKAGIGEKAASLVSDGEVIFIDASTTSSEMVPYLTEKNEVTVITNSLDVAYRLSLSANLNIIILGGTVRRKSLSIVGGAVEQIFPEINISKAFFGAWGISAKEGLTDVNPMEIEIKRNVALRSKMIIGLIDSSKWGKVSFGTFVKTDQVDILITDNNITGDMEKTYKDRGIDIIKI